MIKPQGSSDFPLKFVISIPLSIGFPSSHNFQEQKAHKPQKRNFIFIKHIFMLSVNKKKKIKIKPFALLSSCLITTQNLYNNKCLLFFSLMFSSPKKIKCSIQVEEHPIHLILFYLFFHMLIVAIHLQCVPYLLFVCVVIIIIFRTAIACYYPNVLGIKHFQAQ